MLKMRTGCRSCLLLKLLLDENIILFEVTIEFALEALCKHNVSETVISVETNAFAGAVAAFVNRSLDFWRFRKKTEMFAHWFGLFYCVEHDQGVFLIVQFYQLLINMLLFIINKNYLIC